VIDALRRAAWIAPSEELDQLEALTTPSDPATGLD